MRLVIAYSIHILIAQLAFDLIAFLAFDRCLSWSRSSIFRISDESTNWWPDIHR